MPAKDGIFGVRAQVEKTEAEDIVKRVKNRS
jgi:hypothetical protein